MLKGLPREQQRSSSKMLKSFSKLLQGTQAGRARVCKSSSTVTVPVLLPSLEDFPLLGFVQFVKLVCLCYNGLLGIGLSLSLPGDMKEATCALGRRVILQYA